MYYENTSDYLRSATDLKDKIAKIDTILNGLYDALENSVTSSYLQEYLIDDGQSRIRAIYRSVPDMEKGIRGFEKLRAMYNSQLKGRVFNLKDYNSLC